MSVIKSFFSAFLMYSRIPMPQVEWKEENRRFSLCFFPIIGAVIGGLLAAWFWLCGVLKIGELLFTAVSVALPVVVTGGIHIDGFCDVHDAKACLGNREKLFEVMGDSRIGAFAAINLAVYFIIQLGLFSQIKSFDIMLISALGFVMSRAWSGLAAVTFKCAKKNGTLQSFTKPAHRNITLAAEIFYIILTGTSMVIANPISGISSIVGGLLSVLYYRHFSYKKFGGITGDLEGYFLQICEINIMSFAVAASLISEVIL